jgi:hypothetical protein
MNIGEAAPQTPMVFLIGPGVDEVVETEAGRIVERGVLSCGFGVHVGGSPKAVGIGVCGI